jgi:hypothetical protein
VGQAIHNEIRHAGNLSVGGIPFVRTQVRLLEPALGLDLLAAAGRIRGENGTAKERQEQKREGPGRA